MMEELLESLRNPFMLIYVTFFLSVCMVNGSSQLGEAVELEFHAFRLQQYDMGGTSYGSRNAKVLYEAVSLDSSALRKCVVSLWRDVARQDVDNLLSSSVGALLIIIPSDLDALSAADRSLFSELEDRLSAARTEMAVYVVPSSADALSVLADVSSSTGKAASSATQQLLNSVAANTFQFTSTGSHSTTPMTYSPSNVVGRLYSSDRTNPTIIFVAHYDSQAALPGLAIGSDSNGSGVVVLMELLAVLSRFYENPATRPPYNMAFVWTAAGKYNYQGARSFIEVLQREKSDKQETVPLVMCLDSLGGNGPLHMHAAKQPSDSSTAAEILRRLRASSPNQSVELVTKKISKSAVHLNWEHEMFNIKRMPAVTLSRLSTPEATSRKSVLDTPSQVNIDQLEKTTRLLAEAVLGHMLSLPAGGASSDGRVSADTSILSKDVVDRQRIAHFVRQFASRPRPVADEVATKAVANNIASTASHYAKASVSAVSLQDVQVWGSVSDSLLAEKVKPAVFELFIAAGVLAYLAVFYHAISKAQSAIEGTVSLLKKRV